MEGRVSAAGDRVDAMHLARSTRWVALCLAALISLAAGGCTLAASVSNTPVQSGASSASTPPDAPGGACFSVSAPAGWTSQTMEHCGLELRGPKGAGVGITVDTEPIDAATLHDLIAEKYGDVKVSEETVNGERVLLGTGAVPGAIYIVVQARSATTTETGYYAQGLTSDSAQLAEIERILATIRTTRQ